MLNVALEYRDVIDDITANKYLKLCQYELDDEGWEIVKDLLQVLKVCSMDTYLFGGFVLTVC